MDFPLTSLRLRQEAGRLRDAYRAGDLPPAETPDEEAASASRLPAAFRNTPGTLFVVGLVVLAALGINNLTDGILNTFVVALVLGILLRTFDPSLRRSVEVRVVGHDDPLEDVEAMSVPVTASGDVPDVLGVDREVLARAGFRPVVGSALAFPASGTPLLVAVGVGELADLTAATVRDAAAAFANAVPFHARLRTRVPRSARMTTAESAAAIVEGVLLARHRFSLRSTDADSVDVASLVLTAPDGERAVVEERAARGRLLARVGMLSRDLATCPAGMLTATAMADLAVELGPGPGVEVEVFGKEELVAMGCGGLLGVNRGSVEPPRMIRMSYRPDGAPTGHLALVGKGIMYDSGGINLKPSDESHAQMKNDMSGAAAILAAMTALREVGGRARVTAYLMCTDNMPSGSAMQLGDVLTARNRQDGGGDEHRRRRPARHDGRARAGRRGRRGRHRRRGHADRGLCARSVRRWPG